MSLFYQIHRLDMSRQIILKGVPNEKCHESLGNLLSVTAWLVLLAPQLGSIIDLFK